MIMNTFCGTICIICSFFFFDICSHILVECTNNAVALWAIEYIHEKVLGTKPHIINIDCVLVVLQKASENQLGPHQQPMWKQYSKLKGALFLKKLYYINYIICDVIMMSQGLWSLKEKWVFDRERV